MEDFSKLLVEQKRTSDILSKQRNPLDARSGAGKALLDQQKKANEKLDRIAAATDTSLLEDNLSNLAEIFNARLLQSKTEKFQEEQGITKTDDMLGSKAEPLHKLVSEQNKKDEQYQVQSLSLFEKIASMSGMSGTGAKLREGDVDRMRVGFMKGEMAKLRKEKDGRAGQGKFAKSVGAIKNAIFKGNEDNKDSDKKQEGFLSKFMKNTGESFKSFGKTLAGLGKGLFFTALTVVALGALLAFLRSDYFKQLKERIIPGLTTAFEKLKGGMDATIDYFSEGTFTERVTRAIVTAIGVLFAAKLVIAALTAGVAGLFASLRSGMIGRGLTGVNKQGTAMKTVPLSGKQGGSTAIPKDSKFGKGKAIMKGTAKRFAPLAAIIGVTDIATTLADDTLTKDQKTVAVGETAGGTTGTLAGAAAGAAIGSVIPVIGTAIGGIVGGTIGYFAGSFGGKKLGEVIAKNSDKQIEDLKKGEVIAKNSDKKIDDLNKGRGGSKSNQLFKDRIDQAKSNYNNIVKIDNNTSNNKTTENIRVGKSIISNEFIDGLSTNPQ